MPMRENIIPLFQDALQAVLPENLIKSSVEYKNGDLLIGRNTYHLHDYRGIYFFGSGKASGEMVKALYEVIDYPIAGGFAVSNHPGYCAEHIEVFAGSHPVPTEKSLVAADMLIEHLGRLSGDDFFIYALSGGSSALLEKPLPPLTLPDFQKVTRVLLENNIPIEDVNRVRKHLSMVKGGRLGQFTRAQGVVLVISDVIGDDLETIGSAPFYGDSSSYKDVYGLLTRSSILTRLPENAQLIISKGLNGEIEDTPKHPAQVIEHFVIGSNFKLLTRAKEKAQAQGMKAVIMTSQLKGEAREVAKVLICLGKEIVRSGNPFQRPVCLLFGGETTVTLKGNGTGGRNQELCLSALQEIRDEQNILLLSAGTDGIDGNSDAAGAIVDSGSYLRARKLNLSLETYLNNNDSYHFFRQTHDLIQTGPTGTNVMDLTIMVVT